jgi:hypothetical protein
MNILNLGVENASKLVFSAIEKKKVAEKNAKIDQPAPNEMPRITISDGNMKHLAIPSTLLAAIVDISVHDCCTKITFLYILIYPQTHNTCTQVDTSSHLNVQFISSVLPDFIGMNSGPTLIICNTNFGRL